MSPLARGSFGALDGQPRNRSLRASRSKVWVDLSRLATLAYRLKQGRAPSSGGVVQHCGVGFARLARSRTAARCRDPHGEQWAPLVGRSGGSVGVSLVSVSTSLSSFWAWAAVADAPLWRIIRGLTVSRTSESAVGSFTGPSNIRLHLTAPRERRPHSVRGEPHVIEYTSGALAQRSTRDSSGIQVERGRYVRGAVRHGLGGRAAPQVSRRR